MPAITRLSFRSSKIQHTRWQISSRPSGLRPCTCSTKIITWFTAVVSMTSLAWDTAASKVKTNYLIDALEQLLTGEAVAVPETEAIGCFIGRSEKKEPTGDITYTEQISRLMQQHCVCCHRAGQVAPFALTSYEETSSWAETMLEVLDDGRMPPWHANPAYGHFANDARMSDADKQTFRQWVQNGMPQGDASKLPPPLEFTAGWQIAEPNKIYKMPKPFTVPPSGTVAYNYIVIDPGLKEDLWVKAAEVRPGNYGVVHHAIAFFIPPDREFDPGDPLFNSIGTYAPGMPPADWPEGYARFVPAGSKLVFQMHYTPNGSLQTDQTEVGIVFADPATVKKQVKYMIAINTKFNIPAEDGNYHVEAQREFPQRRDPARSDASHAPAGQGVPIYRYLS